MDVVIPSHNLRTFSSSVTTLSRIGNYLYLEFDPLLGLTLRTLNDAKSAFAEFHFEVGFFERCTSAPLASTTAAERSPVSRNRSKNCNRNDKRRNRKSNRNSKRMDLEDNVDSADLGVREKRRRRTRRRKSMSERQTDGISNAGIDEGTEGDNDEDLEEKFLCRVPVRTIATVLRPRKGVRSLRIKSLGTMTGLPNITTTRTVDANGSMRRQRDCRTQSSIDTNDDDKYEEDEENQTPIMQLSFEFQVTANGIMRIIHKVGVTDAKGVIAVSSKEGCSEIVALPKLLLNMLEPLKQTNEVALTVSDDEKIVTATSFHHSDAVDGGGGNGLGNGKNMVLAALAAGVMKTETSIGCDEFDEFNYLADDGLTENKEDGGDGADVPDDVGQQVTLVFGIKESKALLQFCSQSNIDEELRVIISFHWGGRPITIETEGDAFHSQVILATVDHKLLKGGNFGAKQPPKRRG